MISMTKRAITEMKRLQENNSDKSEFLRFQVEAGGCSGLNYRLKFDFYRDENDDQVIHQDGVTLITDYKTLEHTDGTTIDYEANLSGSRFTFNNPKATRSCGCGKSFKC